MAKILIIGGGFSGLSAALHLSNANNQITLLEASPKLGGRAYSIYDKNLDDTYDNGQHILMGCYNNSLDMLNKIHVNDKLHYQKSLKINFVKRGGTNFSFDSSKLFYPFNLIYAILKYKAISFRDRISVLKFFFRILLTSSGRLDNLTVKDLLVKNSQSEKVIKSFWEIFVVGAMNTSVDLASAQLFVSVMKSIFFSGNFGSAIIVPKEGLSEVYCEESKKYIERSGAEIHTSERVNRIVIKDNKVIRVDTTANSFTDFDYVISAIPAYSLNKILLGNDYTSQFDDELTYAPILNIHLWLDRNIFPKIFYGLIESKIHWVFRHEKHVSLVTSNARELIDLPNGKISEIIFRELEEYFPKFKKVYVKQFKIIKERRATFVPSNKAETFRNKLKFNYSNFFICGDWTDTGLPSTIESAVLSGKNAAEKIFLQNNR